MNQFTGASATRLAQAHPDLQKVLVEALQHFDFMIVETNRTREDQEKAFATGKSRAHYGQSPHDFMPALAADCAPLPLDWNNTAAFDALAVVMETASKTVDVAIVWGGCGKDGWERIVDKPHFQLANWKELAAKE